MSLRYAHPDHIIIQPLHSKLLQDNNSKRTVYIVAYPITRVSEKYSYFAQNGFKSEWWTIRDDQIAIPPAALVLRKGFKYRADLNDAIVFLYQALQVISLNLKIKNLKLQIRLLVRAVFWGVHKFWIVKNWNFSSQLISV
jgi:hypothetical protein